MRNDDGTLQGVASTSEAEQAPAGEIAQDLGRTVRRSLIPDGFVVVERARFERLRGLAELGLAWQRSRMSPSLLSGGPDEQRAFFGALRTLPPDDADPLPPHDDTVANGL
jgi:hypothetical protein